MGEIVSLGKARKAKALAERRETAAENRVRFGRTKAERTAQAAETDRTERRLEGHRREGDES